MDSMSEKERFDAFMRLADFRSMRWTVRRQMEWKLTLGLWASLAAAAYYLKVRPPEIILISILFVVVLMHATALIAVPVRTRQDMNTAFYYVEHAERILSSSSERPRERPRAVDSLPISEWLYDFVKRELWSCAFQISITILLSVMAYFLIGKSD